MTEAERTTLFLKWAKSRMHETFAAEMKIAKGERLPFNALKPHQEFALFQAKHSLMNHKISDFSMEEKPFDAFQFCFSKAYVIIFWYTKPGDKRMTIIDIDQFLQERELSTEKSLTYKRSCEIGRCELL